MKKIVKLLLAFFIVFTITACDTEKEKEPLKISFEKENKFEKLISYNIESIGVPKQITPNTIGTVYHSRYEEWQAILKITDLRVNRIFLPSQIEFHSTTALVILENMVDTYIEGKKTTEEDENRFLADVAKTNPDDKHELKRIISHQYPL